MVVGMGMKDAAMRVIMAVVGVRMRGMAVAVGMSCSRSGSRS
jgi:hypothetical protein